VEDIHFCEQLRVEMEHAGLTVTPQINGVVFQVTLTERYDDRLRAFAHHQQAVADHARELQESNLEGALRDALEGITVTHDRHAQWTERRASEFAATRTLEFGGPGRNGISSPDEAPDEDDYLPSEQLMPEADASPAPPEAPAQTAPPLAGSAEGYAAIADVSDDVSDEEQPPDILGADTESAARPAAEPAAKPKPRAPRTTSAAKARAKPTTTKTKAAPKPVTTTTRRTRRTSTSSEASEA
jgi:hypothetical protein